MKHTLNDSLVDVSKQNKKHFQPFQTSDSGSMENFIITNAHTVSKQIAINTIVISHLMFIFVIIYNLH